MTTNSSRKKLSVPSVQQIAESLCVNGLKESLLHLDNDSKDSVNYYVLNDNLNRYDTS